MKRYFLMLIIIFIFSDVFAQQRNIRSAERNLEKGEVMKARRKIDKATEHRKSQDDPKAWLLKGKIYSTIALDSAEYPTVEMPTQTAIHALEKTRELTSSDDLLALYARQNLENFYHLMMDQAITMADSGQYKEVWKLLAKSKSILPQQPEAYLFEGRLAFALQDFERAKENYNDLIKQLQYRDKGLYEVLNNLITIHLLEYPKIDSSLAYLHTAQQLLPDSLSFYEKEISILINAGNIEQAVSRLKNTNFPESLKPRLFTEVAKVYHQKNQPLQAIQQYEHALRYNPSNHQIILNLAESHRQLAEEKALQADEAEFLEATKHYRSALQYLKKAAELSTQEDPVTGETIQAIESKLKEMPTAQN